VPIVAVEGSTDVELLRYLEEYIGIKGAVIPCGGSGTLFRLVTRSREITNSRVAFLADQDFCCLRGGHVVHPRVVYTWGYSIENDVIAGSRIDRLIHDNEKGDFDRIRWLVAKYFSFEYERAVAERRDIVWNVSLQSIISLPRVRLAPQIQFAQEISDHDTVFCRRLYRHIKKLLRGKQLVQMYLLILNRPGRHARFGTASLLDSCAMLGRNHRLHALANMIRARLGGP
jgi:hypothetical protein